MVTRASQRTLGGGQQAPAEPQTALSKRDRDQTPDAQDSWGDAVEAKRRAEEAETQPTQPPDEARAPASPPDPKTGRNRDGETDRPGNRVSKRTRPQARDLVHSVKVDLHLCLMQAATEGDDERVSWALARGGDPRNPESDGDVVLEDMRQQGAQTLSPVARAALSRNLTGGTLCVRRLLDDGRCNAYAPEYCLTRFRPEVDTLMETQLDSGSVTIVHYAAAKGRLDLLELVLGHRNAPPNAADLDGHYGPTMSERGGRCWPMHLAAMADRPAAIDCLAKHGAAVAPRDCDGFEPLFLAARFGRAGAVAALLRHGAAPDSPTNTQHTALFMATRYGHLACCFALLRAGASLAPRKLPSGNRSPADYVRTRRLFLPRRRRRYSRTGRPQGRRGQLRRARRRAGARDPLRAARRGARRHQALVRRRGLRARPAPRARRAPPGLRVLPALFGLFCARVYGITPSTRRGDVSGAGATIGPEAPLGTTKESQVEVLNFCATTEFVALRKHKYATLRELAAAVAAQYAVVAALFDSECLPDDAFACVASFWLGPRGYDAAPAPRPRLAMPSIELEPSSSSTA